jgi:tRNA threonylcarbamoyladenosine biosynthesis protein TsaE
MKEIYITKNQKETISLGKKTAKNLILSKKRKKALILALTGDLGGGKTTFLKGFAKGLGIKEKILSPTFILMKKFKICANSCSNSCKFVNFYHIDCYRIENPKEILDLGFKEIVNNPKNIVAIEWANKIKKIIPKRAIQINFELKSKKERKICIFKKNV